MATQLIMHKLDVTGVNPDNLVHNEIIPVTTNKGNGHDILVPKFGYFYTESVVLQIDGVDVPRNKYRFTEYYHKASLKYGKQICGSILVDARGLSGEYSLTYQALGGDTSRSASNVLDVYYEKLAIPPITWDNLRDRPLQYRPKPGHLHNQSEIYDIGRLLSYIENIRDALLTLEFPEYNTLMKYIDETMQLIEANSIAYLNATMPDLINRFKAQFTKEYFGLDNLVNMACASNYDAYRAGRESYTFEDIAENKYLTLSSLVMFKEALYEGIVDKLTTNIGTTDQRFMSPVTKSLLDLPIGGNGSYIGQNKALLHKVPFSPDIYPDGTDASGFLTTVKITTNNQSVVLPHFRRKQRGTVMVAYDHTKDGVWLGHNTESDATGMFAWNQFITEGRLDPLISIMRLHIADTGNPHSVTKEQILLGLVENLPVVAKEMILEMKSDRSYLTMDTLLYCMRAHFMQNAWHVKLEDDNRNKFMLDNCQVVFSPCGGCGCDPVDEVITYACRHQREVMNGWNDQTNQPNWKMLSVEFTPRQEGRGDNDTSEMGYAELWRITTRSDGTKQETLVNPESKRCALEDLMCVYTTYPDPEYFNWAIGDEIREPFGIMMQKIFTSSDLTNFDEFEYVRVEENSEWCSEPR